MTDEYRDLLDTETILPGDVVYDIVSDNTGGYWAGWVTAPRNYLFRTPRECRGKFRRLLSAKPEPPSERSFYESMQAIRDAGGSAWDLIPDPEAYLRGVAEPTLNDLRRAYIHRHPSPDEDVLPSMRYAIVCPDGVRRHAATWDEAVAVFDDAVRRECERKGGQS
jgi:hypothetical protein